MNKHLLSVINWNNSSATNRCLESISKLNMSEQPDIILIDNHSTREKLNVDKNISGSLRSLEIINNSDNKGFAGGHNYSLKYAGDKGYDYVFLLNNDAEIVSENVFNELARALESSHEAIAAAPTILSRREPEEIWYAGGEVRLASGRVRHYQSAKSAKVGGKIQEVSFLTGCCVCIKVSALEAFGTLLPEQYFLYWEDADWCVSARHAGYKLLYVPSVRILHEVSSSLGIRSPSYAYYITRNNILFIRRNIRRLVRLPAYVFALSTSSKYFLKALLQKGVRLGPTARALKLGWVDGLRGKGGPLGKKL